MRVLRGWVSAKPSFLGECSPHAGLVSKASKRRSKRVEGKESRIVAQKKLQQQKTKKKKKRRRRKKKKKRKKKIEGKDEEDWEEEEEEVAVKGQRSEGPGRGRTKAQVFRFSGPDSSARRFGEPVVGEPSVHDTRSHLRPTGASRVRLHAHATAGLLKVLLTSRILAAIGFLCQPVSDDWFISCFFFNSY